MRNFPFALLLVVTLSLPGCLSSVPGIGGQSSAADLRADGPTAAETAASIPSTLPERMTKAVGDLWEWYNGLKGKVDPALPAMRELYVAAQELIGAVQGKDWLKALGLATTAWKLVDEVRGMVQ